MGLREKENRSTRRVRVQDDLYAAFRNGAYKVGLVRDISLSGLSFECIDDEVSTSERGLVDIFLSGKRIFIKMVPCKVVYKTFIPRDSVTAQFVSYVLSRYGVQFDDLNEIQRDELKHLLQDFIS